MNSNPHSFKVGEIFIIEGLDVLNSAVIIAVLQYWAENKVGKYIVYMLNFSTQFIFFLMLIFVSSKCLFDTHVVAHSNAHLGIEINVFRQNCFCFILKSFELFLVFSKNSFCSFLYLYNFFKFQKCQIITQF